MAKLYEWKRTIFSDLIFKEIFTGLLRVTFFLSCIFLFIFLPLNPAIYRIDNVPNILCPRGKEQNESHPILLFIVSCPKLL